MKKFALLITSLLLTAVSSQSMSYEQAREQALFLADKMAYELNLTEDQYEACYEINLDYFMGITSADDIYGDYWTLRNLDLSYILRDWQYRYFLEAAYFYRPIFWSDGFWHFAIYARYPTRNYFYFGCPSFWNTYRGGHCWRKNGGKSWYSGRSFGGSSKGYSNRGSAASTGGMRDKFNQGSYGRGQTIESSTQHGRYESNGQSSTRSTVGNAGTSTSGTNRPVSSVRSTGTSSQSSSSGRQSTLSSRQTSVTAGGNSTTKQNTAQRSGTGVTGVSSLKTGSNSVPAKTQSSSGSTGTSVKSSGSSVTSARSSSVSSRSASSSARSSGSSGSRGGGRR